MKYLIAVDSSENSHYAFSQAKKRFFTQKDHVYILTVTESPTAYPFEDLLNFSTESYNEMNRKIEQMYAELLKKYGRKLTRSSIPHTCLLARGTIKDVICRQAQDLCVDVVIMGRRGLGTLERTFIGSTSQYCVHNLNCSVMVIPYIEQEKTPAKQPEELATEISSKEEEEVSGKEFKKGSKFEKIGQYEKEKWQQKEIKSEEFEGEDHPPLPFDDKMLKDQKKHLKHEEDEGTIEHVGNVHVKEQEFKGEDHPTLPFDDKMLKEQKKHLKHEEFEEENLKDRPAVPFDDKMLKEQKKHLKHEEEFEEENLEHPSLPFDDKMLKEQKGHLKHEEGTINVIEERKVDEPTKNVAKESTKKKRKNKKKKNNNNNKGNVGKSVGKWEDVTKESSKGSGKVSEKDLPPPLPIESLPHDISSEPITGDLLEKQKKKLKHEEGSIDVIEEETNPKHVSENIIHKGEGKSSAAASSGSSEISSEGAKKKKNRKKRKNNKNKAKETTKETTKKSEKVSEKDLPPPLPIESLPHDISSEPITGDLLEKQKKKLKHEEGSIDVIEEETKQKDVGENLQQNVPVKEKKTKRKKKNNKKKNNNNNNNNKGKAEENLSKESSKKSEKVSEKDLPPPLPIESLPHNISSEPITGDLLEKQKKKLKHEEGSIDVIEEETKELEGNIKQKGKEKGKKSEGKFEKKQKETNVGSANISGKGKSQKGSEKGGEGKWKAKDISGTKEELKHEGGAGKFERLKEQPITSSPPMQKSSQEKKECNDPLCNNSECEKHGVKSKEHGPKWQGKVHEKKECNDPLCSNPNCAKHGKLAKEKEKEKNVWKESGKEAGKEAGKEGGKEGVVPPGGKSFAEVVSSSQGEEKGKGVGNSPQIVQKSEHKAAINIGEGKIEGKFGSSKDEEGKWKGSVEIGFKGKDEKGHEKQGKSLEASVQSK